jgi:DNA-binding IclR family transcriptional regulator
MADSNRSADRNGVQVIARAAAILRAVEEHPEGLSLGELAERLGLARSTIQRIVGALVDEQLLMSAGARAGVMLGPGLVRMAAAANIETDKIVRPVLQRLSRTLGETVDLSVRQGRSVVFLDQVVGSRRLVAISAVGEAFPLHCTANGKALLALASPERRRALLSGALAAMTPATITDPEAIEAQLDEIARTQLAFDLEEHAEGICAVGAAFIDPLGRPYAISVPAPVDRFMAARPQLEAALLAARSEVLALLQGRSS